MSDRGDPSRVDRQGRRRLTSEEFEPLTSRQEAVGSGGGACARGFRCCRARFGQIMLGVWAAATLFLLAGINGGVRNPPAAAEQGLDLAALAPALDAFPTEFCTFFTTNLSSSLLLMEFPIAVVDGEAPTPLIFGASFARGTYAGHSSVTLLHFPAESTEETVFMFRLTEDKTGVDVLRQQLTLRTSDEGMVNSLLESAPPAWITTLPVLEAGAGGVVVNAEHLVTNGFYVTDIQAAALAGVRLKLSETRAYPKNAGVTVEYQLIADPGGEPGNVVPISIRFSISALPAEPMQPRLSDERVGYFNTVFHDLGDHRENGVGVNTDLMDTQVALINKRRMGGDADPLIYYVDPSVPPEWRDYLRTGVESWQPAFEAAGLGSKAIRAVLPEESDWPEDYDAGDIRFNSITWAVDVDSVFAQGPSTLDPRTGEILHSGIVFTDGWIKSWSAAFEIYGDSPSTSSARRRSLEQSPLEGRSGTNRRHAHSHAHGHGHSHSHSHAAGGGFAGEGVGDGAKDGRGEGEEGVLARLMPSLGGRGRRHGGAGSLRYHERSGCQEARLEDLSMSLLPLIRARSSDSRNLAEAEGGAGEGEGRGAAPGLATNEILGAGLADVVMHEVGHTLGLRHNFEGSTQFTLEELQDPSKTGEGGLTSSVMDYLPLNIVSSNMQGAETPHYFTPRLGEYDMWAIKYGYMVVEGEELLNEHEDLLAVASEALPFSTDEDGVDSSGVNPMASVFDLGKEPMDYWEDRLELVTELWPLLLDRTTEHGRQQQFSDYGRAALSLLRQVKSAGLYATKYLGGFDISKQRRVAEDTPGPIQLISSDRQRRALALILRVLGGDDSAGAASFLPAGEDFSNMAVVGGYCEGLEQYCYAIDHVDVLGQVSSMRKTVLLQAFSLERLLRLRLHSWATASDGTGNTLSVSEAFKSATDTIWGESAFSSGRAKLWQNWDVMVFWLEVLQAYGSAPVDSMVPGDVSAVTSGLVYAIVDSGSSLNATDPAYPLHRTVSRKVREWEERGTDGVVLRALGGFGGSGDED